MPSKPGASRYVSSLVGSTSRFDFSLFCCTSGVILFVGPSLAKATSRGAPPFSILGVSLMLKAQKIPLRSSETSAALLPTVERLFHGSVHFLRVGSEPCGLTRPVRLEKLLTRHELTHGVSITPWPDPTRSTRFQKPPDPLRGPDDHDPYYSACCHYWLFPSVSSDFTGTIAGNRHYRGATTYCCISCTAVLCVSSCTGTKTV